jgi:hypothetical protein
LEGSWHGRVVTPGQEGSVSITFSGQSLEFHGVKPDDWVKGTFTLREDLNPHQLVGTVTECSAPDYVGKTSYSIYKIENGALTITGFEPGSSSSFPSAFDAPDSSQLVFQRVQ